MAINYFFYKAGAANVWLSLAEEHGLYVGFSDDERNGDSDSSKTSIATRSPRLKWEGKVTGRDDDHIAWIMHPDNAKDVILILFDKEDLYFFNPTPEGDGCRSGLSIHRPNDPNGAYEKAKTINLKLFSAGGPIDIFKTLPVKLIAKVSRSKLHTSIDSLSVYQFLNRGTCRPIWRIVGPTGPGLSEMMKPITLPRISENWPHHSGEEKPFGALVRLYFNDLLSRYASDDWRQKLQSEPRLSNFTKDWSTNKKKNLVWLSMNPILVETAAFYFCLDLGLLPDVGVGKGLDVVDIRARLPDRVTPQQICDVLSKIPVQLSEGLRNRIYEERVLEIQCKASQKSIDRDLKMLRFGYWLKANTPDTVHLPTLHRWLNESAIEATPEKWLSQFINMQVTQLFFGN
ncbi:hypothetical protein SH139x_002827 [Planctomycetaceae bacterium SH139]